ncbi:MAG: hypothetical protein C4K60_01365 [Ideonella sp. MAG2]|nr:MAG: hypothetical protein C4K60_01365 [Ideonella sp. MAG2]
MWGAWLIHVNIDETVLICPIYPYPIYVQQTDAHGCMHAWELAARALSLILQRLALRSTKCIEKQDVQTCSRSRTYLDGLLFRKAIAGILGDQEWHSEVGCLRVRASIRNTFSCLR